MSEENCEACKYSYFNNKKSIFCDDYRRVLGIYKDICGNNEYFEPIIIKYPKPATFLEAVEWMELGNKAKSPKGLATLYIKDNNFLDALEHYEIMVVTPNCIKGEWQLLAPEKPEKEEIELLRDFYNSASDTIKKLNDEIGKLKRGE